MTFFREPTRKWLQRLEDMIGDLEGTIGDGDITSVTAGSGLTGGGNVGAVSLAADFGTGAGKVTQGNDSRLSDARTPTGGAGGQLGGTYPNPDVRGLRETSGPTALTIGAVADGQVLARSGSTLIGVSGGAPTGGAGGQLGGTYPNPDVRGLRETSGPTALTIGAVADGEYLRRSGSTLVGASAGSAVRRANYWDPPATPHGSDQEFDGTSLPVALSTWRQTGAGAMSVFGTLDTVPPSADISYAVAMAGGANAKAQVAHPKKPSELVVQMATSQNIYFARQFTVGAEHIFRARLHRLTEWGGSLGLECYLMITRDSGSNVPSFASWIRIGLRAQLLSCDYSAAGSVTLGHGATSNLAPSTAGVASFADFEVALVKNGAGTYTPAITSGQQTVRWLTQQVDFGTGFALHTGQLAWVGLYFVTAGVAGVMSADYLRQSDDVNLF